MIQSILINRQVDELGETIQKKFLEFLENFKVSTRSEEYQLIQDDDDVKEENNEMVEFYKKQCEQMKTTQRSTMFVDMKHFFEWDRTYELRELILNEAFRFQPYLNKALEELMKKLFNIWANKKTFYVNFYHVPENNYLRDLRTSKIGKLITISGTVTRTSEVRPELILGSFKCRMCNTIISNIEQQFRYTEPRLCTNSNCNNRTKWELNTEDSIYADWQKLRVQENPSDIPPGSMPRSIDVILRNELVEMCKPGDKCEFAGCLLVVPDIISLLKPGEKVQHQLKREAVRKEEQKPLDGVTGLKNLGIRDLTYKMIFIGQSVNFPENKQNPMVAINAQIKNDKSGKQVVTNNQDRFTDHEKSIIGEMKEQQNLYSKLAKCIAPGVYGHEDVKKGILLMLFGGVNKNTSEGIKLRGDLNVCIVGDPSVAKSQFLKYVCQLLPRAVYTSGKGSTAAGLTASVQRDSESGEFCIEAGALMLADNSICCIDEFDKMDSKDQVAIHEAMEQQTISIAKAGIQATLMARTSILAAANPLMGRYDKTKSLKYNIDISAPIMSRFDLFFVVVDERDDYSDFQIAEHIVGLHRAQNSENAEKTDLFKYDFSQEKFILYLRFAKSLNPRFTKEAAERLREEYQGLRQSDISYQKTAYRITVRQLESLVRLSEALARVHLDTLIHPTYVSEAAKLLRKSIISVDMPNIELDNEFERKLQEDREKHQDNDDVVMMDADTRQQKNKIIISGGEYEKWKTRIVILIRELENNSVSVKLKDIIEYLCEENFDKLENHSEVEQFSEKINAIIERLINNDGILIVLNDDDNKFDRILSVNVNYEPSSF